MVGSKETAQIALCSLVPGFALLGILMFVGLGGAASAFAQHTYYVSKSAGSDSNTSTQAESKSTPWAHIPGMAGATSTVAAYTPVAGDTFILKGCDVWVASDLPVHWNWSGSSGNPITIGVDKTWYNTANCPSAWNRPILDAQGTVGQMVHFADPGATSWGVWDNIEMKGLGCTGTCSGGQWFTMCFEACSNWTISNNYFHAWRIQFDNECAAFSSAPGSSGTVFTNNIVDGSDSNPQGTCYGIYPSWPSQISNNVIHDLPNGIVGAAGSGNTSVVSGNLIYNSTNSNGSNHCNHMEVTGGGTHYIYNNVIHDATCSGGEAMMVGSSGENSYIWNNLLYNLTITQAPNFPQTGGQSIIGLHFWNNTIVTNGSPCFFYSNQPGGTLTTLVIENNQCITTAGSTVGSLSGISIGTQSVSNNTLMTPTTATSQGYTSSETFAYSPTAGTNSTVGAGKTICGAEETCTGNLAALAKDTTYACTQRTVNGVVQSVCPARTIVPRAGDVGAYQYAVGGSQPNPPTGLTAMVQ